MRSDRLLVWDVVSQIVEFNVVSSVRCICSVGHTIREVLLAGMIGGRHVSHEVSSRGKV